MPAGIYCPRVNWHNPRKSVRTIAKNSHSYTMYVVAPAHLPEMVRLGEVGFVLIVPARQVGGVPCISTFRVQGLGFRIYVSGLGFRDSGISAFLFCHVTHASQDSFHSQITR